MVARREGVRGARGLRTRLLRRPFLTVGWEDCHPKCCFEGRLRVYRMSHVTYCRTYHTALWSTSTSNRLNQSVIMDPECINLHVRGQLALIPCLYNMLRNWLPSVRREHICWYVRAISRVFSLPKFSVLHTFVAMAAQANLPRLPRNVKFRVLIIGRANAGKTSILQRVCDTTESPVIYSVDSSGTRKQVRSRSYWHLSISSSS